MARMTRKQEYVPAIRDVIEQNAAGAAPSFRVEIDLESKRIVGVPVSVNTQGITLATTNRRERVPLRTVLAVRVVDPVKG